MTTPEAPPSRPFSPPHILAGSFLAFCLIVADQATKIWARDLVPSPAERLEITSFFNLVHVWNYGVSFGMMQSGSSAATYTLIGVAALITLLFTYFLFRAHTKLVALGAGTVIGGAIGNIIDRFQFGAVYDFLDFHAFGHHWPAFNVADSCVLIGILLIILDNLRESSKKS